MNHHPMPVLRGATAVTRRSRRGQFGVGALLLAALAVCACGSGDPAAPPARAVAVSASERGLPTATTALDVRVVDSRGRPLAGIDVTLSVEGRDDGIRAFTNRGGTARFAELAAAQSAGIWVARRGVNVGFAQVRLQPGRISQCTIVARPAP